MERITRDAIRFGLKPLVSANFADQNNAAVKAIADELGIAENASAREIKRYSGAAFALIEEVIDELLPKEVEDILGRFAEVRTFARDAEILFKIENKGLRRARLSITKGARGGIYKAARLDSDIFQMPTYTQTVGVFVTLEDLLLGRYSLAELFNNILKGFVEIVYKETVEALRTAKTLAPKANIKSGSTLSLADVDACVRIVSAYGRPAIFGFKSALSEFSNKAGAAGLNPNVSTADLDDIRAQGYIGVYKGTPIIELPNYLIDETNANWMFDEKDIFVLPSDSKPVKVAFRGEMMIKENVQPTGSEKWEAHKMMGVGLALVNNVCVITNTSL